MANSTNIQWTDATWNIAVGCTKVDSDCKNCYMYRESLNKTRYNPAIVRKTKTVFDFPLRFKKKTSDCWPGNPLIFTSSLTDLFHEEIDAYRNEAWDIIRKCPQYIFQILTKRPERIIDCLPADWGNGWKNVWIGTSVGHNIATHRMAELLMLTAKRPIEKIFLSLEPLHSPISPTMSTIIECYDWVIVGGESGNEKGQSRYRPCELKWIEDIVTMCKNVRTPVFVKQLGTHLAKELNLKHRHGGDISEWPQHLQIRQLPNNKSTA